MVEFAVHNSLSCLVSRTCLLRDVIGARPTIAPSSDGSMMAMAAWLGYYLVLVFPAFDRWERRIDIFSMS